MRCKIIRKNYFIQKSAQWRILCWRINGLVFDNLDCLLFCKLSIIIIRFSSYYKIKINITVQYLSRLKWHIYNICLLKYWIVNVNFKKNVDYHIFFFTHRYLRKKYYEYNSFFYIYKILNTFFYISYIEKLITILHRQSCSIFMAIGENVISNL